MSDRDLMYPPQAQGLCRHSYLAEVCFSVSEKTCVNLRTKLKVHPVVQAGGIPAPAEFATDTLTCYSTYEERVRSQPQQP